MEDFLTTRQVIELLKVDRITIYRMLQDGRLKGSKIGHQWRFPRSEVDQLLTGEFHAEDVPPAEPDSSLPIHCIQAIQDLFSAVSRIGSYMLDSNGEPLTRRTGPKELCDVVMGSEAGLAACQECWKEIARSSQAGRRYFTCHAGFNHIGAPVISGGTQVGFFLVGPYRLQAVDPEEQAERLQRLSEAYDLPFERLKQADATVPVIPPMNQAELESWPSTAARAVQSILIERTGLVERLRQIASLTQIS